ncbi:Fic family protein [uncultured Hymenobacter sp.]|uniref:Fic family protein n=1 Tax=uncultured Hymenobacter sp. TaxID=170016 RepID=UPI0035CABC0B
MASFAELDQLKAELDTLPPLSPDQEAGLLQESWLEWNYSSNALEGNSLTLSETRRLLRQDLTAPGKPLRDHLRIRHHDEAVRRLEEAVRDQRPLTETLVQELNQLLQGSPVLPPLAAPHPYQAAPASRRPSAQVLTPTGELFYFATPDQAPASLPDVVNWYQQELTQGSQHPVALAVGLHYRFLRLPPLQEEAYYHGPLARLLLNYGLLSRGYPITVVRATDRNHYYAALTVADSGNPEPLLRFLIDNVAAASQVRLQTATSEPPHETAYLDQKLAQLKKKLLGREDAIVLTWNLETQAKLYYYLLEEWLKDLQKQTARFDDLFVEKSFLLGYYEVTEGAPVIQTAPALAPLLESAAFVFNNASELLRQLSLGISWQAFRLRGHTFNLNLLVSFTFDDYGFQVQYQINELDEEDFYIVQPALTTTLHDSTYRDKYDLDHVAQLNHELATRLYNHLADAVPALAG